MVVVFLWLYFVSNYYVALGKNLMGQSMGDGFLGGKTLGQTAHYIVHKFLVSTPWIAPIGGTII